MTREPNIDADAPFASREIRLAGVLGILGMALGVAADLASGFSLEGAGHIGTAFSVLSLENLSAFLASKPTAEVVAGHYVAILGIPLGIFGLWQVYRAMKPAGQLLSSGAWFLGVFGYVVGTVFHSTFAFVTFGIKASQQAPTSSDAAFEEMLGRFALVFEPLGWVLVGVMGVAFVLIFVAVVSGRTHYPRWFAVANPLVIQAVTGGVALVAPPAIRVFLIVTAYNLSILVFYLVSTLVLWNDGPRENASSGQEL